MTDPTPTADPTSADPTPSGTPTPGATTVPTGQAVDPATEALQVILAAEHAAVFVYGALGGQTSRTTQPTLFAKVTAAYRLHRDRRDELTAMLEAAGVEPVAAEPGYALPADLGSTAAVTARALALEEAATASYAYLVANTTGAARRWAVRALLDASVRGLGFGGRPDRLPGI